MDGKKIILFRALLVGCFFLSTISFVLADTITVSEENVENLLTIVPEDIDLLFIYSIKLQKEGKYILALDQLEKIKKIGTNNPIHYLELARLQFYLNKYEDSRANFEYIYSQNPPTNIRYNIRNYLKSINQLKPLKINYNFKISYNDNINNGTYSDTIRLFGIPK